MPLTPAERQKLYRERLKEKDPEKFLSQKRKNADRTREKRKKIADYAASEQENIRKQWRDRKKKSNEEPSSSLPEIMPSAEDAQVVKQKRNQNRRVLYKLKAENIALKKQQEQLQKALKNCKKRINRSIKKNIKLLELIEEKNNLIRDLEERLSPGVIERNDEEMTPSSKTDAYIQQNLPNIRPEEKDRVKKTLLEHHVIVETMKQSYQSKDTKEKQVLKDIVKKSEILDKYRMKTKIATYLGLKGKIRHTLKKNRGSIIRTQLREFYERDDISKMTAGKNEIKTQNKQKKQRRYLLGTLRKLHLKYCQEGGQLSFATFKRYRPFYVLPPKAEKRETCACKKHENLQIKATLLKSIGLVATKDLDDLLAMIVCDTKSNVCAYGECELCKNKHIDFTIGGKNLNDIISWDEWNLKHHEYKGKINREETKITKKMVKEKKSGSLKTLLDAFQEELQNFKTHSYNILHQYKEYRRCTKNLDERTIALHIDFSENYSCKLSTEIQAMHFGASRQQITLHTGIVYTAKGDKCFASISPNNEHGPDAIWAHLLPVLKLIRESLPGVDGIHFYSDGPTVQYRQKKNFYYFAKITKELGFPFSTWNFFEANHGKGAADGVGGAIKRRLDSFVAYGYDITDASTAFKLLQESETKIKLFYIPYDSILKDSPDLVPVPNTMKIHQIINNPDSENSILYRNLSCFCQKTRPGFCNCFNVKPTNLLKKTAVNKVVPEKKVTVLTDIRNTEANMKFFDLTKCTLFNMKRVENISPSAKDINKIKKTQKKRKLVDKNQKPEKKQKMKHESSTDEDAYSLHDSSEYCISEDEEYTVTKQMEEARESEMKQKKTKGENKEQSHHQNTDRSRKGIGNEAMIEPIPTDLDICFNDSLIVRYYQRGTWKYYIGFIEDISVENGEKYYTINYLKTVKNPTLKFVFSKIKDRDTVTEKSIVKKIEITQNPERPKEYFLAADCDSIYFN